MFKDRPVIGVMPLWDDDKESYWMLPGYMKAIEMYGAIPLMLPLTEETEMLDYFLESCDGFMMTGGHDIAPEIYGAERSELCEIVSDLRDTMDIYVLKNAVEMDKPVMGICRGLQLMNAVYGGTLYQDISTLNPSDTPHRMKPPYDVPRHEVSIVEGSPLHKLIDCETLGVNSLHHQAIDVLSPEFESMAVAPDGIVEAIYMPGKKFVWAVQWHPEFAYQVSPENQLIMKAFVEACAE